jgi:hypothetical protein
MPSETETKKNKPDRKITIILILMAVGLIIAQFASFDGFIQTPSILPETPALERLASEHEVAAKSQLPFYRPVDTFGAEGVQFGTFTHPYDNFPRGASIGVYAKDNRRLFQIAQYPNHTVTSLTDRISYDTIQELNATFGTAALLHLHAPSKCFEPTDEQLGVCATKRVMLVQKPGMVVALSTGNSNLTDGQLIKLGRSLEKIHQ